MKIDKRLKKKFINQKTKYIIILLIMALSILMFIAFQESYGVLIKKIETIYDKDLELLNFSVSDELNDEEIDSIEGKFNVKIYKRMLNDVNIDPNHELRLFEITKDIDHVALNKGRLPEKSNEVVLNTNYCQKNNIKLFDKIVINNKEYTIVGNGTSIDYFNTLKRTEDILVDFEHFGVCYMNHETIELTENYRVQYLVSGDESSATNLKKEIEKKHVITEWLLSKNNPRIRPVIPNVRSSYTMGLIMSILFMIIGSVVVTIILDRDIKAECKIVGVLKAFGYKKNELLAHYLRIVLIIATVASIIGITGGVFFGKILLKVQYTRYELPNINVSLDVLTCVIATCCLYFILCVVSAIGLGKILGFSSIDLMRNNLRKRKIIKLNFIDNLKFKYRFHIKLFFSNFSKIFILFLAVIFSTILVFSGMGMADSVNLFIDEYNDGLKYNKCYVLNGYYNDSLLNFDASKAEGVETGIIRSADYKFKDEEYKVSIQAVDENSGFFPNQNLKQNENEVIISRALCEKFGIKNGDYIKLYDQINEQEINLCITKTADWYISNTIFISKQKMYELYNIDNGLYNIIYSERDLPLKDNYIFMENSKDEILKGATDFKKTMDIMNIMIQIVACIMAVGIIYIIMDMIMEEKRNDISMIKIMGYHMCEIRRLYLDINNIFVLGALIIGGFVVKKVIKLVLYDQNLVLNGYAMPKIKPLSIIISTAIIIFTYIISNVILVNKIKHIDNSEVLKNRE